MQEWQGKSLRQVYECELCLSGVKTNHNDSSHDQSLDQKFSFLGTNVECVGGTTKCGRVMAKFFESLAKKEAQSAVDEGGARKGEGGHVAIQSPFQGKACIEVGAGTGIVSLALAIIGAKVTATDQEPMMDMLRHNIGLNSKAIQSSGGGELGASALFWGSDALQILKSQKREKGPMKIDHVIGSDLIFAKEGIEPLAKTYEALCHASGATGWLACILRFKWEASFFELMDKKFDSEVVHKEAEISIYKFTPRLQTVHVQARAREEKDNGI